MSSLVFSDIRYSAEGGSSASSHGADSSQVKAMLFTGELTLEKRNLTYIVMNNG